MASYKIFILPLFILAACGTKRSAPPKEAILAINLKKGEIISCSPSGKQFGNVSFEISCSGNKDEFNEAMAMLHSFEYDEAEKSFARIIDKDPGCAMSYWGVAMANYHPLWSPPTRDELEKGARAIELARSLKSGAREKAYINAIGAFYNNWQTTDHRSRTLAFEKAMEKVHSEYPSDKEAALFYCLALDAAADPADKTYLKQKKAGEILQHLYPGQPLHPGLLHYIIHTYDLPSLANLALPAARKYAGTAPSSAHAQHMPSHIFTRLGLWDECIRSNIDATNSAKCYAESAGIKGHWDEELHGLDYLVYAYLQKGDNLNARQQLDYLLGIKEVNPRNFKVAYAFAAIPARYALETRDWNMASHLNVPAPFLNWNEYPWQAGIIHFAKLMGYARQHNTTAAEEELAILKGLQDTLMAKKDEYKAIHVNIQIKTGMAWIALAKGDRKKAEQWMNEAANMEDHTEKSPVTPGEVLPARELLGDLYLALNKPAEALVAYEASLETHPNRFNGLYGAAIAALRSNNREKATNYFRQLLSVASKNSPRSEIVEARNFLKEKV